MGAKKKKERKRDRQTDKEKEKVKEVKEVLFFKQTGKGRVGKEGWLDKQSDHTSHSGRGSSKSHVGRITHMSTHFTNKRVFFVIVFYSMNSNNTRAYVSMIAKK